MAIYFMHYNFVRIHQTIPCTPAMSVGVTTKLWELTDLVKVSLASTLSAGIGSSVWTMDVLSMTTMT
jgi:hypothetical protein